MSTYGICGEDKCYNETYSKEELDMIGNIINGGGNDDTITLPSAYITTPTSLPALKAGKYLIIASATFSASPNGNTRTLALTTDQSTQSINIDYGDRRTPAKGNNVTKCQFTSVVELDTDQAWNEVFKLCVYQDSGSSLSVKTHIKAVNLSAGNTMLV